MPSFVRVVLLWLLLAAPPAPASAAVPWVPPVDGPVAVRRAFDPPRERWDPGHRGVDLASYPGAAVRAAGAGRVSYAGVLAGRGVVVVVHGALRTTYEPVSATVAVGDTVGAGDDLGTLDAGHAGPARAGEALLHWGLLRGETYLDPMLLLRRGPSRLLPVSAAPARPAAVPARAPDLGAPAPHAPRAGPPVASLAAATALGAAGLLALRRSRPP